MNKRLLILLFLIFFGLITLGSSLQMDKEIEGYGTIGGNYIKTTFQFKEGWNLVHGLANPSWIVGGELEIKDIQAIYTFDRASKEYVRFYPNPDKKELSKYRLDQIISSSPFWVHSNKSGFGEYFTLEPNMELTRQLIKGWNFVTAPIDFKDNSLDEIKGNCIIESMQVWDIDNQKWDSQLDKAFINSIGFPAIINVSENCKIRQSNISFNNLPPVEKNDCKIGKGVKILGGNNINKVTFVFIPDGYSNISLWKNDIGEFTDYLFGLEPFQSYQESFDVWRIDDLNHSYVSGSYSMGTDLGDNERDIAINISRNCINKSEDLLIVIKDNSFNPGDTFGFSSTMPPFFNAISRLQGPIGEASLGKNALVHEIGHGFAYLGDEYNNNAKFDQRASWLPNVDEEGCPKWCSGFLNNSSPCFERYKSFMVCLANVTNNFKIPYNFKCDSFLHNPSDLDNCNLGTNCKNNTGCYWRTNSLLEFRSSPDSIMRHGDTFEGIDLEIIKNRIINLTT